VEEDCNVENGGKESKGPAKKSLLQILRMQSNPRGPLCWLGDHCIGKCVQPNDDQQKSTLWKKSDLDRLLEDINAVMEGNQYPKVITLFI
jgi:hypothetical protein